jgi:hypothetical protein
VKPLDNHLFGQLAVTRATVTKRVNQRQISVKNGVAKGSGGR